MCCNLHVNFSHIFGSLNLVNLGPISTQAILGTGYLVKATPPTIFPLSF